MSKLIPNWVVLVQIINLPLERWAEPECIGNTQWIEWIEWRFKSEPFVQCKQTQNGEGYGYVIH